MASGKKNYFRHSFFARNDIKMLMLKDAIGIGYYFYYFSLLELCGEESSEELSECYTFHDATIRSLWGVNLKKSERIAMHMNAVGLLEFKKGQKNFQFTIPNLSKYLGKYTNKKDPNIAIKEKKRKEKEIKENIMHVQQNFEADKIEIFEKEKQILTYWNSLNIINHKENKNNLEKIQKAKKQWPELANLKITIDNYYTVLRGDNHWSHKWTLWELMTRKNADKFYPDNFIKDNYIKTSKAQRTQDKMVNMENPYDEK